jgi:hypothetical protein
VLDDGEGEAGHNDTTITPGTQTAIRRNRSRNRSRPDPDSPSLVGRELFSRMSEQEVAGEVIEMVGYTKGIHTKKNTSLAYYPRIMEYKEEYCWALFPREEYSSHMTHDKAVNFMYYQSMRNKRSQGGRKSGRRVVFDLQEYTNIE